jgi:hypothetical protein
MQLNIWGIAKTNDEQHLGNTWQKFIYNGETFIQNLVKEISHKACTRKLRSAPSKYSGMGVKGKE